VESCNYDAIHVRNGLAVVDYDKCIGCAACAKVCPHHLIEMVPFHQERMPAVLCSNPDFGADVKKACRVGCIGCSACRKAVPQVFEMQGKLARVKEECLEEPPDIGPAMEKCPTHCIGYAGREG
jgi:ferredoxin